MAWSTKYKGVGPLVRIHNKQRYEATISSPITQEHGRLIRARIAIWEKNPTGKPPTLKELAEELEISRERVRQICIQEKIDRPHARRGRVSYRKEDNCPKCGSILPFRKTQYISIKRCQVCNPTNITVKCTTCDKEFVLLKSILDARLRKDRGSKGRLYCSRDCFFEFQKKSMWWKNSPIQKLSSEKKVSVLEAHRILKTTDDQ